MTKVIIVGAGIGGLTAAIGLRRAGLDVTVFEKRTDPRVIESGGGMIVQSNALRGLKELDAADEVISRGSVLERFEWRTPAGKPIATWPVGNVAREVKAPVLGIRRMNVQGALIGSIEDGTLELGAEVTGFAEGADGVTVQLASGGEERGDLLVGVDGINSTVRSLKAPPVDQAALRRVRPLVRDHAGGGRAELLRAGRTWDAVHLVPRRRRRDLLVGDRELARGRHRRGRRGGDRWRQAAVARPLCRLGAPHRGADPGDGRERHLPPGDR